MEEDFPNDLKGQWDQTQLPTNVQIGKGCFLERKSIFSPFVARPEASLSLGDRVSIYTWTAFNAEPGACIGIGDDTILVGAIFMAAQSIRIGKRCIVSYNVTIADSDFHPRDPQARIEDAIASAPFGDPSRRPPLVSRPVVIEDDVWIGIGAIILKGVRIGAGARIGPGAVVTSDVPPGATAVGNPARPVP